LKRIRARYTSTSAACSNDSDFRRDLRPPFFNQERALGAADWRRVAWNVVGAGALALVAAGFLNIPALLAAFTPRPEPTGAAFVVAGQLRWGAGVAAVFLVLRAAGLFKIKAVRDLLSHLGRGNAVTWAVVIFGVALVLRLGYAFFAEPPPISDEQHYDALAANLAAGNGYASGGIPVAYWPVGYSAFVAAFYLVFGHYYLPVIIFQTVLGAATAAILLLLAREFLPAAAAHAAGLIVALWPNHIAYASRLFPAALLTFAVVTVALAVVKLKGYRGAILAGMLTGLAALAAPVALVLPGAALACDLFRRVGIKKALARAGVVAAVAVFAVAPWAVRNGRVFDAFVLVTTNGGVNLWIGNNPKATGTYNYPTSRTNPLYMTEGELERDRLGRELAWYFIRNERAQFLLLAMPKFVYTYGSDVSAFQLEGIARGVEPAVSACRSAARVAQSYYALIWVGFILGLVKLRGRIFRASPGGGAPLAALLVWPVALTLVYMIFFGEGRFHLPMVPFIAALAAAAFIPPGNH
jgi:4-amino-4-deoxy-L-arabinose transferase-like glycosyltransferase